MVAPSIGSWRIQRKENTRGAQSKYLILTELIDKTGIAMSFLLAPRRDDLLIIIRLR
jgi:hypothetical protein